MPDLHRLSTYHYDLPPELIAAHPAPRREDSRLMLVDRASGTIEHRQFRDFPELLAEGDRVVMNNSKVINARLIAPGPPKIEIFLLEEIRPQVWKCLAKPGRKTRAGCRFAIAGVQAEVLEVLADGSRIVAFDEAPDLDRCGEVPLPPYLHRPPEASDRERYQTVYAANPGSVAAPTAGLHFTPDILARIPHTFLTLHVGAGTFLPVKTDDVRDHAMHEEWYQVPEAAAREINAARRIVAIGTTVVRTLESLPPGPILPGTGRTAIFIRPGHTFHHTGALLTNFHLPGSTLLMLICAFAGYDLTMTAYRQAVQERYRFFSYGDCMFLR